MTIDIFPTGQDFRAAKEYVEGRFDADGNYRSVLPEVLGGDLELMVRLCESSRHRLKYMSGVDSWPTLVSVHVERRRVNGILDCLAPGMGHRIAHAVIRHSEHHRTENHHLIARIDLWTGLSFTPFWHAVDIPLLRAFNAVSCIDEGLIDPDHPGVAKIVPQLPRRSPHVIEKMHEDIAEIVTNGVRAGTIVNRDDVVSRLQECGYKVMKVWRSGIKLHSPTRGVTYDFCSGAFAAQWKSGIGTDAEQHAAGDRWDAESASRRQAAMQRFNVLWAKKLLFLQQRFKPQDLSPCWEMLWQLPLPRALQQPQLLHPIQLVQESKWKSHQPILQSQADSSREKKNSTRLSNVPRSKMSFPGMDI